MRFPLWRREGQAEAATLRPQREGIRAPRKVNGSRKKAGYKEMPLFLGQASIAAPMLDENYHAALWTQFRFCRGHEARERNG